MTYRGDLFDVLPTLPEASVDACVTDPPYELAFMGKAWDRSGVAFNPATWSEILRVLKPGAYLLAFGGTRTFHRMTCAIEDAGFEIRDSILYWGFGQGFPKSLNVSNDERFCQCAEERGRYVSAPVSSVRSNVDTKEPVSGSSEQELLLGVCSPQPQGATGEASSESKPDVLCLQQDILPPTIAPVQSPDPFVLTQMQRRAAFQASREVLGQHEGAQEGGAFRIGQSVVEGRRHVLSEARELQADQVRPMPGRPSDDGSARRICDGAPPADGAESRPGISQDGSRTSQGSRSAEQRPHEPGVMAGQPESQTSGAWPRCSWCGKSVVPKGLGTALKPAYEPIVLARKPLAGTVAANVEKHGTGALNIDACRIGHSRPLMATVTDGQPREFLRAEGRSIVGTVGVGRWPANVVLDDQAAAMLDAQSGELVSGANPTRRSSDKFRDVYSGFAGQKECEPSRGLDIGGASRFFYVAKPSREERDLGCYDLEPRQRDDSRKDGNPGGDNPRNRGLQRRGNFHPTVKPIELMRWLVRLVTPPGGTVLDPFMGSGTTGCACAYELRPFIGIEREADYIEIAERRIAACAPLFTETSA